jgi:lipoate-protein ligase B
VCADLSPFDQITPCGISNVMMTSIEKETATSMSVAVAAVTMEKVIRQMWQDAGVTTKS